MPARQFAIVTGASSGIGLELATMRFARSVRPRLRLFRIASY